MRIRKGIILLYILILFSNLKTEVYAETFYDGGDFRLEREGDKAYLSMNYPLKEGGYEWTRVYRINNVKKILEPINYKLHFDQGAGASGRDEFPYIEVDEPLDIETLREDIFLDANIYKRQGKNFKSVNSRIYMEGMAKYLVYDDWGEREEVVNTSDLREQKKEWDREGKKYLHSGYEKSGRIYSKDGKFTHDGVEKTYSHFLIRGENWRDKKPIPRVFIKFSRDKEPIRDLPKFTDVKKTDWYSNYVIKLVELGGVEGYEDGSFRPEKKVRLGEFLKMSIESITEEDYSMTDSIHWATGVYDFALENKIINKSDFARSKESLNSYITREDMVYISNNIDRYLNYKKDEDTSGLVGKIGDFNKISKSRQEAVLQAYKKNIINGRSGNFVPKGLTTRAEATTVVVRLLDR